MSSLPRIAISLGDPGGIGPEITARALTDAGVLGSCVPIVYGSQAVWERGCQVAGVSRPLQTITMAREATGPSLIECEDAPLSALTFGVETEAAGRAQARYLERAVDELVAGATDGLCTAPINKHAVHRAGLHFAGHTEYLHERFGVPRVVMLMAGDRLRVALATTHVAIRDVPVKLRAEEIVEVTTLVAKELGERFGIAAPRIAICGLNPHAGEQGQFGDEEIRLVTPAIAALRERGINAEGPFPADGLFPRVTEMGFDAVIALYHDQGLIPFKMMEFHTGVNVTLGLPKPRTSPDHGVAYDIAGQGIADARSMLSALRLCVRLCVRLASKGR
jgi:4-hydroxythreonine-4-phosphate dehydrogenase